MSAEIDGAWERDRDAICRSIDEACDRYRADHGLWPGIDAITGKIAYAHGYAAGQRQAATPVHEFLDALIDVNTEETRLAVTAWTDWVEHPGMSPAATRLYDALRALQDGCGWTWRGEAGKS